MARFDNQWGATVPLPTNPESKSRAAFDNVQGNGIDALGYCHGVAAHLVGLCEELMALPAVDAHIVNPSPQITRCAKGPPSSSLLAGCTGKRVWVARVGTARNVDDSTAQKLPLTCVGLTGFEPATT